MNLKDCQNLKTLNDGYVYLPNYGFRWEKSQDIPLLHVSLPMKTKGVPLVVIKGWYMLIKGHYKYNVS